MVFDDFLEWDGRSIFPGPVVCKEVVFTKKFIGVKQLQLLIEGRLYEVYGKDHLFDSVKLHTPYLIVFSQKTKVIEFFTKIDNLNEL